MRLRTLAGAHAGEIREYEFNAGRAALQNGTAERLVDEQLITSQSAPTSDQQVLRPAGKRGHYRSKA